MARPWLFESYRYYAGAIGRDTLIRATWTLASTSLVLRTNLGCERRQTVTRLSVELQAVGHVGGRRYPGLPLGWLRAALVQGGNFEL